MIDFKELKRLAEGVLGELAETEERWPQQGDWFDCQSGPEFDYLCAANPSVVLALIAEVEFLVESRKEAREERNRFGDQLDAAELNIDQLKSELKSMTVQRDSAIDLAILRKRERDEARAEVEPLSKENKSLRGSCEALGKDYKQAKRERNAAIRENGRIKNQGEVLRKLALELRGSAQCSNVHHNASEQHDYDAPCKVLERIDAAISKDVQ